MLHASARRRPCGGVAMIPLGYCTIPEAIMIMEHMFQEGEALGWLEAGLLDGDLQVFTQRGRQYDVEVCRIPWEDVNRLGAGWVSWIATGVVPSRKPPLETPESKARWDAWRANLMGGPSPDPEYSPWTAEQTYSRCQFLLEDTNFGYWLGRLKQQLGLEGTLVAKTGAPGKPSSMHLVLAEFQRRRTNGLCESSRSAEAAALAAWLLQTHPSHPPATPKTIRTKLPTDFQPARN